MKFRLFLRMVGIVFVLAAMLSKLSAQSTETCDTLCFDWKVKAGENRFFHFKGTKDASFIIHWGDGKQPDILIGQGYGQAVKAEHQYTAANIYRVRLYGVSKTARVQNFDCRGKISVLEYTRKPRKR